MRKQKFFINDFSGGILADTTKQSLNSFKQVKGLDIWGEPWKLLLNKKFKETAYSSWSDSITSFGYYVSEWKFFAGDRDWKFYFSTGLDDWTLSTHTDVWYIDCKMFLEYQGYFFYCKNNDIWYFNGVAWTDDYLSSVLWGSFENGNGNHIMVSFNEKLYISDDNVVAEIDGSSGSIGAWIFTKQKCLLEFWEEITAMVVLNGYIAIGTNYGWFYLWDWESEGARQEIKTWLWSITAMIEHQNTLFVVFANNGDTPQYIYQYNGSDFIPIVQFPKNSFGWFDRFFWSLNWLFEFKDWLIFKSVTSNDSWSIGCLYVLNKWPKTSYALTRYWEYWNEGNIEWFFCKGGDILINYEDDSSDQVVAYTGTGTSLKSLDEELETLNYEVINTKGFNSLIQSIMIDADVDWNCDVQYSFDNWDYTTAVSLDYNQPYRIDTRCHFFSIKLTNIDEGVTWIRIY